MLMQAMQKFFKIFIELFYIAFFQQLSWLLSCDEVEIERWEFSIAKPKNLPQPSPITVSDHRISYFSAYGKRKPSMARFISRIKQNPMTRNPLLRIFSQLGKLFTLCNAVRTGKAKWFFFGLGWLT